MYFDRKCKITYICHGTTIYSEEYRFSDVESYPSLSDSGQDEISQLCEILKRRAVKNDRIYSSNSLRATQTAKEIAKVYKKEIELLSDLKPRKCGKLNGLTVFQADNKYHDLLEKWYTSKDYDEQLEAESLNDFAKRVSNIIDEVVNNNIGNRVIIVTYPEVIQVAVASALGLDLSNASKIYIETGSATQISYFEDWESLIYSDFKPIN